jgi:hypothetical protein
MDGEFCVLLHFALGGRLHEDRRFNPSTNTPIFFTAPSSCAYCAFTTTYEGFEANFFQQETVLKLPGCRLPREDKEVDVNDVLLVDEFIAKENLYQKKKGSSICRWANGRPQLTSGPFRSSTKLLEFEDVREDDKEVREDDETIQMANSAPDMTICQGPLTFDPSPPLAKDKDVPLAAADNQAERMRWHYCLGHLHFPKLKLLTINGEIPKKLAKVTTPKCAGCLFGAMTKLPWRGKEKKSSHLFVATKRGETVSVNQMASTEVGFFAQLKGTLTKKHYRCRTIFVDHHYSCLLFIHLQINDSAVETIAAKRAFKAFAAKRGVCIQHYHCNNGQFYDNAFRQACHESRQCLNFYGVNAHFQNGIAERAIRNVSKSARKQLPHACARWPAAVHFGLWPYALRNAYPSPQQFACAGRRHIKV